MLFFRSCQNSRYLWHDLAPKGGSYLLYSKILASKTVSLFSFSQKMRWKFWSKWSRLNESAWLKQTAMSFGTNLTRRALRDLPFVRTFHLWSLLTVPQLEVARSRSVGEWTPLMCNLLLWYPFSGASQGHHLVVIILVY